MKKDSLLTEKVHYKHKTANEAGNLILIEPVCIKIIIWMFSSRRIYTKCKKRFIYLWNTEWKETLQNEF